MKKSKQELFKAAQINGFRGTYREFLNENSDKYLNDVGDTSAAVASSSENFDDASLPPQKEEERSGVVLNMTPIAPSIKDDKDDNKILGLEKNVFWIAAGVSFLTIIAIAYFLLRKKETPAG